MRIRADRLERILSRLKAGARDERGVTAVIFAIALAVLTPVALGVFDIYVATEQKGRLQDALDAATLYAARSNAQTDAAIDAIGDKVLAANLKLIDGTVLQASDFHLSGTKVVGSAQVQVVAFVPELFYHPPVSVTSEVQRAIDKLEIALVLDNTGSMVLNNSPKLATLKTEAKKLVDKLQAAAALSADPTPIRISLVPFSNTVRVQGTTQLFAYNISTHAGPGIPLWIDPQGKAHGAAGADVFNPVNTDRLEMMKAIGQSWSGCVEGRRQPYDIQDDAPTTAVAATMYTPYFWPDEPDSGTNVLNNYKGDNGTGTWMVRQARASKYTGGVITGGNFSYLGMTYARGPNAGCVLQPVIPLTADVVAIKAGIDNMTAVGETNIPLGMAWGWNTLSPTALLASSGSAYGTQHLKKIVILMTDGENTYYDSNNLNDSGYGGLGYIWQGMLSAVTGASTAAQRTTAMNDRLAQLCTNMKAKKIEVYTVRVEVTSGSSSLLQGCASSPDKFFDVSNVAQLGAAFDAIAAAITNLRITK